MKKISQLLLLPVLFLISHSMAISQKVTVSEGISIRSDDHFRIIGSVDQTIALLTIKGQQLELHAFDSDMHLRSSVEVDILHRNSRMISSVQADQSFFLFSQKRDGQELSLYFWEFDHRLRLIDSSALATASQLFGYSHFYSTISDDLSKILFFRSDNNTNIQVLCFDILNKEVIWSQNFQIDGNLRQDFRQMMVSNKGEMVLVLKKRDRGFRRMGLSYQFLFLKQEKQLTQQSIEMVDKLPSSEMFLIDNYNRRITGGGIYYERNSARAEGQFVCFVEMDKDLNPHIKHHPFTLDILASFSDRNINRGAVTELELRDVMLRKDGGLVLFSEINKVFERRPTYTQRGWNRNMGRSVWTDYHLEDVLISSFHGNGDPHWFDVLYKKQNSQDDGAVYSSFFIVESPGFLRIIYNDDISGNSTVSEFLIAANGFSERKNLMNTEYQNVKLRFRNAYQKSADEIIIPSEAKSRLSLVRIKY